MSRGGSIGTSSAGRFLGVLAVTVLLALLPTVTHAQDVGQPASTGVAVVLASSLNVRAAPRLDGAVVGALQRGDTVCVVGRESDWLRVRRPVVGQPEAGSADQDGRRGQLQGFAARGFLSETRLAPAELRAAGC